MTWYSRSDYGSHNPNAGRNANGDTAAWGGYQWQNCPPSSLLGTTDYTSKFGQRLRVTTRKEIVELMTLMFKIADKHDYLLYANKDGENWGPWGMDCRAVSGTSTPSGHSKGLSMDWNAPYNPYSYTFQSDMPPAMVADIESCGWYWGGRYEGQKYDAMHYGYCFKPADVAGHVARANSILGGQQTGDWFDMASQEEIQAAFTASLREVFGGNPAEQLSEIRRMLGVSIGGSAPVGTEHELSRDMNEHLAEIRRLNGVAIGYEPAPGSPEYNLAPRL